MFKNPSEPEHRTQLRESVADFVARSRSSRELRADLDSPDGFSPARWREMAELGWTGVVLPEDLGGLGLEFGDLAALHHEAGRAALPEPLAVVPLLAARALAEGENPALAERLVPALIEGSLVATLGWQSARGALGAADVGVSAEAGPAGWQLSGKALFVPIAPSAAGMVVAARAQGGVALFWLDRMPPLTDALRHADGSRQATAVLDGIAVPSDALIAGPQRGGAILESVLDIARLAASAELLGLMERAFEMTLEHLRTREQYGKPIGSYQALQHRAVNLYVQIELSRSALDRAVAAMDAPGDAAVRSAQISAAKSRCGDAARLVIKDCIQMSGAMGYTAEYDLSLYVNRVLFLSGWLGNPPAHRGRWSRHTFGSELRNGH